MKNIGAKINKFKNWIRRGFIGVHCQTFVWKNSGEDNILFEFSQKEKSELCCRRSETLNHSFAEHVIVQSSSKELNVYQPYKISAKRTVYLF